MIERPPSVDNDEEEEGALAEEEEEAIEDDFAEEIPQPPILDESTRGSGSASSVKKNNQLLFPVLASPTFSHYSGNLVYGSRETVSLLKDLVDVQIQSAPEGNEYYKMGLKNALATLTDYAQLFQMSGEDFLRHMFAEHILRPNRVGALKRLSFRETGGRLSAATTRHRQNNGGDLKRRRNMQALPHSIDTSMAAGGLEEEVPSTLVKWPPDGSLSDISSD